MLALPLLAILFTGCPDDYFTDNYDTAVIIDDQELDGDGDIVVAFVIPYGGDWLAIHRDDNGAPNRTSRPIGGIKIDYERHVDFKVRLDSAVAPGERLWGVLHMDNGRYDTFEYDGTDTTDNILDDYYYTEPWDDFIVR